MIKIIACYDRSHAIGYKNKLLYKLPNDLKRFKELTTGHFVLFGRKTFESILVYNNGQPLPNRENVVLTRQKNYKVPLGVHVFDNVESIIKQYTSTGEQDRDLWVCGGSKVYEQLLPYADELHLTVIDAIADKADSFFPIINTNEWKLVDKMENNVDEKHECSYSYLTYKRIED